MPDYFDCHADTLTEIKSERDSLRKNSLDLDLERVHAFAGHYAQVFALWRDRREIQKGREEEAFMCIYRRARQLLQAERDHMVWCRTGDEMKAAFADGKGAAFLSVEDISIMGSAAERIRELGISFAMLTWNYENEYACGAAAGQNRGLSRRGRECVRSLLAQKIVLDISHLSDQGAEDIFLLTDRPVIASHSNVRDICPAPRNLKMEQIRELIRRKGLIGMNFYAPFVGEKPELTSLLRHIDVILEAGGEDVLALGTDFDGCSGCFPKGVCGVQSVPDLWRILAEAGFSEAIRKKIFFENAEQFVMNNLS